MYIILNTLLVVCIYVSASVSYLHLHVVDPVYTNGGGRTRLVQRVKSDSKVLLLTCSRLGRAKVYGNKPKQKIQLDLL